MKKKVKIKVSKCSNSADVYSKKAKYIQRKQYILASCNFLMFAYLYPVCMLLEN